MKVDNILAEYIKQRVYKKNKNFLMLVVGSTGSGKSYGVLKLAEQLDPTFTIEDCCFKAKEFMDRINFHTKEGKKALGKVVVWDEIGVEHSSREFMTISNRVMNYFFQTCRNLNMIVLMTCPLLSFVDSATRKLAHCIAETGGINTQKKLLTLRVKTNQTNVLSGKEYMKYLRVQNGIGKRMKVKKIRVGLPSKTLLNQYEKKKMEFNMALNREIMEKLEKKKQKEAGLYDSQVDYLTLQKKFKGNVREIAKYLGFSERAVYKGIRKAKIRLLEEKEPSAPILPKI